VPARSDGFTRAVPIKSMGRFAHEALAVEPETRIVYLTELK
jgi:secreted PhoX family phosphatase